MITSYCFTKRRLSISALLGFFCGQHLRLRRQPRGQDSLSKHRRKSGHEPGILTAEYAKYAKRKQARSNFRVIRVFCGSDPFRQTLTAVSKLNRCTADASPASSFSALFVSLRFIRDPFL